MNEYMILWLFPFAGIGLLSLAFELATGGGEQAFLGGVVGILLTKLYFALRRS